MYYHQVGCPLYLPGLSSSTSTGIVNKRKSKGCVVSAEVTTSLIFDPITHSIILAVNLTIIIMLIIPT